jgi:hypothetical protein
VNESSSASTEEEVSEPENAAGTENIGEEEAGDDEKVIKEEVEEKHDEL